MWIFTLLHELFLCFLQAGRGGQCFILHLQVELTSAIFFQARILQKFSLTLSNCMIASPVATSCKVYPVEGSTFASVFYCIFKLVLVCSVSTILEASTVCYISSDVA